METTPLLHDLLDRRAVQSPGRPALRSRSTRWTFAELRARSIACAQWLERSGVRRGDRVLIDAPHAPETVAALFGAARLGALYAIVTDRLPDRRFAQVVADCQPRILLTQRDSPPVPDGLAWERLDRLPSDAAGPPDAVPCISVDPVSLIYTSGSTSTPKAVVSTHAQVVFAAAAVQDRLGYQPGDTVFCCLPLSFDYGLYQVFLCCLAGAELVLAGPDEAGPGLLTSLTAAHPTIFPVVPTLAETLLTLVRRRGRPPQGLRLGTSSGATLAPHVADGLRTAIPGLALVSMFGLTECKRVTIMEPDGDISRPGALGRPLRDTEVLILDERGRRLAPGEVGELVVRGQHVMAGYWRAPELTARKFRRDESGQPMLFTGDLCRLDTDGYLYFVGRSDDIYKERGFRVSAAEVEAAALDVDGVRRAAVLPPEHGQGALLVVSADLTPERVLLEVAMRLEDFKVPAKCHVVAELPLGISGKVDRRAVAEMVRKSR